MSKGILVHAFNNEEIDYVKQAVMVAERAKKYLNLPTSIITDCMYPNMEPFKLLKPLNIQKIIGKKPVFSSGNSDGDLQMMQWTASNKLKSFMLYVHHI